jgi:hypothetical protein
VTTELVLFLLRLASGILLIIFLLALFYIMWCDYRSAVRGIESTRRVHGQLTVMHELDGSYIPTSATYPLLPLTSLGRAPTNTIPVDDSFASSEHAIIAMRNGQWWLEDRQSRNGTTLNELPVRHPVIITDGDIIGIGNMRYRIELEK